MLNDINRAIANTIYLVPLQLKRFQTREPHAVILAAGATKALKRDRDTEPQYEAKWIVAQKGTLILTTEKLILGSLELPFSNIEAAQLLQFKVGFGDGLLLKIATTEGDHYQFGLQYDPAWEKQTSLNLKLIDGQPELVKLKFSKFSIALRLLLIAAACGCYFWIVLPAVSTLFSQAR